MTGHVERGYRLLIGMVAAFLLATAVNAADAPKLAIKGYDPVAYFTDARAVIGKPEFHHVWQNLTYQFASAEHRDQFASDPEHYLPQFGAYCALGIAMGKKLDVDPEAWTIVNGKLYLNHDKKFRDQWRADQAVNIAKAEENWRKMEP